MPSTPTRGDPVPHELPVYRVWNERVAPRQTIVEGDVSVTANRYTYFERRGRNLEYWNIAPFTLRVRQDFDEAALEETVARLIRQHDGLRMQLSREGSNWRQHIAAPSDLCHLVRVDFRGHSDSADFVSFVESTIADVFHAFSFPGPLFKVLLVRSDRGRRWVVCAIAHHLTMDSDSVGLLLEDFDTLYRTSRGQQLAVPAKTTSYADHARYSTEYWLTRNDALEYWRALPWERVRDLEPDVSFTPELNTEESSAHCIESTVALSEPELGANDDRFVAALLAAVACAYGEWTRHEVLLITVLLDGRDRFLPAVDLSRTLGYFNEFVPMILPANRPIDEIHDSARRQLAFARTSGRSYGVFRYLSPPAVSSELGRHPIPQVSLNVLPRRARYEHGSSLGANANEFHHPPGTLPTTQRAFLLSAGVFVRNGRLCLGWDFSERLFRKASIASLTASCMRHLLSLLVENAK